MQLDFSKLLKIEGDKIFAPLKKKWFKLTPEERVRQEYIQILIERYGYALDQMDQEYKVSNSKRGNGQARADIIVWRSKEEKLKKKSPVIVVECKAQQIKIREEDYFQGQNYASMAGADFFITTNQKETRFFRVEKGVIPKLLNEIIAIPSASDLGSEKRINEILSQTKAFTRDEFSKLLFKCHNIIRNNDKLSPEAAFDEISKILFMKIRYERDQSRTKAIFSKQEFESLKQHDIKIRPGDEIVKMPFYQYLFAQTKGYFVADELFEINDVLKIRETSFLQIVKELEKYNLSDTSDDVKGIAFEKFLGTTFRGELGQFFTPRTVVDYIVDILDPQEGEVICDPCCGSGGFLIKTFEYIREQIESHIHNVKEDIKGYYYDQNFSAMQSEDQDFITKVVDTLFERINSELDLQDLESRLRKLSYDCIFGTDANPRMARTAKMNMIMHGDGHGGVHHHDGLLNVNGIYDERFDVIVTNPPFGSRVDKQLKVQMSDLPSNEKIRIYNERYGQDYEQKAVAQIADNINEPVLNLFDVGKLSGLTEVLFLERCLNLLRPGGRLGVVLPEGILNSSSLQRVREFIEDKAKLINITSIPQDVFMASGATVKPSVVFLKKFTQSEVDEYALIQAEEKEKAQKQFSVKYEEIKQEYEAKRADLKNADHLSEMKILDKKYREQKRELDDQLESQIRQAVKARFTYLIPMVEVQSAGISSTGAVVKNELDPIAVSYREYRKRQQLWTSKEQKPTYCILDPKVPETFKRIMPGEVLPTGAIVFDGSRKQAS